MAITVEKLEVQSLVIPTASPESDGTLDWDRTTVLIVEVAAGGRVGLGWSYASRASAEVIREALADCVRGADPFSTGAIWQKMISRCRNLGRPGVAMMAISAIDVALWDLKARLLGMPVIAILGSVRERVPIYGSGGFTNYGQRQLAEQLAGWAGLGRVKMKVGRDPAADPVRVGWARAAVGEKVALFVDANGAYSRKQAARLAEHFGDYRVSWFEEPVSSDDLVGLRWLRDRVEMDIAAGEYGFDPWYFEAMLAAGAVDVLQADATRCGGITGFLRACAIADAHQVAISSHCAPNLHAHVACAAPRFAHAEYFHDHVRVEQMLFEGVLEPRDGALTPDQSRPGLGLVLKRKDAARHAA
jgi:L-alanine-DL-glutamate epimerase-like enolase superfamily enzyme